MSRATFAGRLLSRACLCFLFGLLSLGVAAVKDSKHYKTLDVSHDADEATIKRAYRKLAMKWHPDRNPEDKENAQKKFREVAEAYEILSDPEKRKQYDQFGEDAFKSGGGPGGGGFHSSGFGGDPFEMFNMFFGNRKQGQGQGMHFEWSTQGGGGGSRNFGGGGGCGAGGGYGTGGGPRDGCGAGGGGGGGSSGLYESDRYVKDFSETKFDDLMGWVHLVELYAPWCGHCRNLAPKWTSLAKSLDGLVKVGAINCDEHGGVCQTLGVQSYPTILAFVPGGKASGIKYNGNRSGEALKKWALGLIPNEVTSLNRVQLLDSFLNRCKGHGSNRASWKLCLVLFTDKTSTPSIFKSLSSIYKDKIALGEIRSDNTEVASHFNVTETPSVVAVCNGDMATLVHYQGQMKMSRIRSFLDEYASGRKCDRAIQLNANSDFSKLSVSQMKAFISEKGETCAGCIEKSDFAAKVRSLVLSESDTKQGTESAQPT